MFWSFPNQGRSSKFRKEWELLSITEISSRKDMVSLDKSVDQKRLQFRNARTYEAAGGGASNSETLEVTRQQGGGAHQVREEYPEQEGRASRAGTGSTPGAPVGQDLIAAAAEPPVAGGWPSGTGGQLASFPATAPVPSNPTVTQFSSSFSSYISSSYISSSISTI